MVQIYSFERYRTTELTEPVLVDFVKYEDYKELEDAVIALLADINRRYPGEGFKCPLILKLAEIVGYEPRN